MSVLLTLWRRQLRGYFHTPLGYAIMTVFLAVSGLSFCRLVAQSLSEPGQVGDVLFGSVFSWLIVLISIALLTMQSFAEEKRTGTIEMLMTAPVTDIQVVLAKYLGACSFFALMCLPTLGYSAVLVRFGAPDEPFDIWPLLTGYGMFFLICGCYIAFGLLVSSLTRNQAVAALLSLAGMGLAFFSDSLQHLVRTPEAVRVLEYVSSVQYMTDFSRGIVDTRPLVLYLAGIGFFLFATVKSVESRQWR